MGRPSISTSSLLLSVVLKPRAEMAKPRASVRATCRLGASARASGSERAPEARMVSPMITNTEAGTVASGSACMVAEVTSRRPSSSRLRDSSRSSSASPIAACNGAATSTVATAVPARKPAFRIRTFPAPEPCAC